MRKTSKMQTHCHQFTPLSVTLCVHNLVVSKICVHERHRYLTRFSVLCKILLSSKSFFVLIRGFCVVMYVYACEAYFNVSLYNVQLHLIQKDSAAFMCFFSLFFT